MSTIDKNGIKLKLRGTDFQNFNLFGADIFNLIVANIGSNMYEHQASQHLKILEYLVYTKLFLLVLIQILLTFDTNFLELALD